MNSRLNRGISLLAFWLLLQQLEAAEWSRFRGPNGSGVIESQALPVEFGSEKNLHWKVDSGQGTSSPIVSGGCVYYSSFAGGDRTLVCLDAATGAAKWSQAVKKVRDENYTPTNNPATCTPVVDGPRVFVFFPDAGIFAFSVDGTQLWTKDLGPFQSMHGLGASLVVVDGRLMVLVDQLRDSYLAALDTATGEEIWRQSRVDGLAGAYSTPVVHVASDGRTELLVAGPLDFAAYDPASGDKLWWAGVTNAPIGVPVLAGTRAFVCEPPGGEFPPFASVAALDRNKDGKLGLEETKANVAMHRLLERIERQHGNGDAGVDAAEWDKAWSTFDGRGGLAAVELGGKGDVSETHIKWTYRKALPQIPSLIVIDGLLYAVNDGGVLMALNIESGEVVKRDRLKGATGSYYASPVAADGKLFFVNTEGKVSVIKPGRDWEVLATNDLGEDCYATPAIADGRIYFRTDKSLFCFGT